MLTIKVCSPDGHELVKEIDSAMLRPGNETATGRDCVTYWEVGNSQEGSKCVDVFDGTVYVMNSHGKTVANYDLDRNYPTLEVTSEDGVMEVSVEVE